MFCPKCGNEMPEGAEFCMKCGTKIKDFKGSSESKKAASSKVVDKKNEIVNKVKNNKKVRIICLAIAAIIVIGIVALIVNTCANSEKAKAYDEGVAFIQNGNVKDAEDSFKKAEGYKDANIYLPSVTAADQLYNQNSPGDALTTVTEMLKKDNNLDTITKYADRESSKLASFMIGEVYYANDNWAEADKFYSSIPINFKFINNSCYERKAFIALVGKWSDHCVETQTEPKGTHSVEYDITEEFTKDGINKFEGHGQLISSDNKWVWYATDSGSGKWKVDNNFDGTDGSYHYIFVEDNTTFNVTDGVLNIYHKGDNRTYSAVGKKIS